MITKEQTDELRECVRLELSWEAERIRELCDEVDRLNSECASLRKRLAQLLQTPTMP